MLGRRGLCTDGYGFICLPRNITQRLADRKIKFGDADAWLDLWCHTVWQENSNAFSYMAPTVQFGTMGAALTLEALGRRWGWEKTKVWRFLRKYGDAFALYRLPGSGGCLIFNKLYPADTAFSLPESAEIVRIIAQMRILAEILTPDLVKTSASTGSYGCAAAQLSRSSTPKAALHLSAT